MPRYFFDVRHVGDMIRRDYQGCEVPDLDSAEIEALEIWKQLNGDWTSGGDDPSEWIVEIHDDAGRLLARMPSSLKFGRLDVAPMAG